MTPTDYRAGGADDRDPFRRRRVLARLHPGGAERQGRLRDPARRRSRCAGARSSGPLPARDAHRRRRGVRADRRQGDRLRRERRRSGSTCRWTSAARRSSSASGQALREIPAGRDRELRRDRGAHRRAERRARRRAGVRRQRAGRGDPLPSCRAEHDGVAVRLPLGRRAQAAPARRAREWHEHRNATLETSAR